jgi:hypothetical protein
VEIAQAEAVWAEAVHAEIVQAEVVKDAEGRVLTALEWTLSRARDTGLPVVLAGTQGGPSEVEGFQVSEYIAMDAPDGPPIASYPQSQELSQNEQYRRAIDEYILANYKLGEPILHKRLEGYDEAQIERIATSPTKLEIIIQSMELKLYTPEVPVKSRSNGRYYVPLNDLALSLPAEEYTFLIQVVLKEGKDPLRYIHSLQLLCKVFNPEHEADVVEVREVLPNLTERVVTIDSDISHPIRIRFRSSFCFKTFLSIEENSSYIREKWEELKQEYTDEFVMHTHRLTSMQVAAVLPGVLPEHGLETIKTAISNIQTLLLSEGNDIMIDWCNEGVQNVSTENFATVFANEVTPNILKNVCDIPLRLPLTTSQPIKVHEVNDSFHVDVIARHSQRMKNCTVSLVDGIPSWANIYETMIIPPTNFEARAPMDISIGDYIRRLQLDGTISDNMNQVFTEVLVGNRGSNFVIIPHQFSEDTERLLPTIVSKVQECLSDPYVGSNIRIVLIYVLGS